MEKEQQRLQKKNDNDKIDQLSLKMFFSKVSEKAQFLCKKVLKRSVKDKNFKKINLLEFAHKISF